MNNDLRMRGERSLPEFQRLSDASAVLPVLRSVVQPRLLGGRTILGCTTRSVRHRSYSPGAKRTKSSIAVVYDLSLGAGEGQPASTTTLHLRGFLDGRSRRVEIDDPTLTVVIPDLDAYAWVFPGDPSLPGLRALTDGRRLRDLLNGDSFGGGPADGGRLGGGSLGGGSLDGPLFAEGSAVSDAVAAPLRYKPEDRCTLRVTADQLDGGRATAVVKVFSSSERSAALFADAERMWVVAQQEGSRFVVPRALQLDEGAARLWLSDLVGAQPRVESLSKHDVVRIGEALASFHRSSPLSTDVRIANDLVAETSAKAKALVELFPPLASGVDAMLEQLVQTSHRVNDSAATNVHGAFRLRQLLISPRSVGILDFDSLAIGDPLEDVADLLIDLGHGRTDSSVANRNLGETFLVAYEKSACPIDRRALSWYVPIQLFKRASWLRHGAARRPQVAGELFRRVAQARLAAESLTTTAAD